MAGCVDCLKNCGDSLTRDRCVKYTGAAIPLLGICTGDSIFEVDEIIINQLLTIIDGTGITLEDVTLDCPLVEDLLDGEDKTLPNLIQVLLSAACSTQSSLDALIAQVNASFSISGGCLTLPSNPTRDQVLQAIVVKLCSVSTSITTVSDDYVKASELCDLVTACIAVPPPSGVIQENVKMSKYIAYPYHGPLTVFDAAGTGISAMGYEKVYLCVGQTVGTFTLPDYRGRSPIGANTSVPGGSLDSAVNPALPANAGYSITAGTKKGEYTHMLIVAESASHNHAVTDPGHFHNYFKGNVSSHPSGNATNAERDQVTAATTTSTTGITIASSGGDQPHNTAHPVLGCNFILYIP
jgi:microcystin-dependent protein